MIMALKTVMLRSCHLSPRHLLSRLAVSNDTYEACLEHALQAASVMYLVLHPLFCIQTGRLLPDLNLCLTEEVAAGIVQNNQTCMFEYNRTHCNMLCDNAAKTSVQVSVCRLHTRWGIA